MEIIIKNKLNKLKAVKLSTQKIVKMKTKRKFTNLQNLFKNKSFINIFLSIIPEKIDNYAVFPAKRCEEIIKANNLKVKNSKFWAWHTLEFGILKTFGVEIENLKINKTKVGKWECNECFFSLSHTDNIVAVAISNQNIGVDIENFNKFKEKFKNIDYLNKFAQKIITNNEIMPQNVLDLIKLWTKKESLYKFIGKNPFVPNKLATTNNNFEIIQTEFLNKNYICTICAKNLENINFFFFGGSSAHRLKNIVKL